MQKQAGLFIFGEVLFDCFPGGEQILGGAPFNVAWHLQALGDRPLFISRIGEDAQGGQILQAMRQWGMETGAMQIDTTRPTGRVEVRITNNEPSYDIVADSAYDRISAADLPDCSGGGVLYHGTLALRQEESREALRRLSEKPALKVFLDVNLRAPWWKRESVVDLLHRAYWAKMNELELQLLTQTEDDIAQQMEALQNQCGLEQLIVTRGRAWCTGQDSGWCDAEFQPGKGRCCGRYRGCRRRLQCRISPWSAGGLAHRNNWQESPAFCWQGDRA